MPSSLEAIQLRPALRRAVERKVKRAGVTADEYIRSLVERDLRTGDSFDDVLRPIRQGFGKAGVTPAELDALVAAARRDVAAATRPPRQRRRPAGK
jgi:hypothetical protein